ncbi:glycosyltransferase family 39 protein [Streptomyces acidicola]|uniref:Glycosyltransferase RgtA/B/C/D-like domain-containing protein n=1 Tax=Streptomyces acidicola TaxID=2596892 RepID=A0A5N8WQB9_9ACTN|nr:glycosyltransferase family 39 protein [Streptomyces acidicola]MPY49439.1 hypothetical protein [Streptomyces acidicola]
MIRRLDSACPPAPADGARTARSPAIAATQLSRPTPARTASPRPRSRRRWAVGAPVALSLVLGLWGVRRDGSLWRDEVVTYDMARRDLPDLAATLEQVDAVHGLYYLLMHGLFALCDDADPLLVLRLPSVVAGAAACGLVALLGHRLAGARAGLLSGIVFALLPPVQRFAQEGRSYALVCALVVWSTWLLVRAVDRGTARLWAGYTAVLLTACLLHEFAVLVAVAHAVVVPRTARPGWVRAVAVVLVGLAPLAVFSTGQSEQVAWIGGIGAVSWTGFGLIVLGAVCARLLGTPRVAVGRLDLPSLGLALTVLPALVLLVASLVKPLYVDRYVLYGNAGTALLAGAVLDRLGSGLGTRVVAAALTLALVPVTVGVRTPESRVDDVAAVEQAIRQAGVPGDGILYMPSRRRVWSLHDPGAVRGLRDLALERGPVASSTLYGTEAAVPVIRARMLTVPRLVAVRDPEGEPLDRIAQEAVKRDVLAASFEECDTLRVRGARVTVFARPGKC